MTRNEMLQGFILGFGLSVGDQDLGRETSFAELWSEAKKICFDCERNELLDALYTLPRQYASLIKMVASGEGAHPVSFERVRNVSAWPDYFTSSRFNVKVFPAGKEHHNKLAEEFEKAATTVH
jgi:hypothetical protein